MIKVFSLYDRKIVTDITSLCKSIQLSGDKDSVAEKLDLTIAYPILDKNQPSVQINPSALIWVEYNEEEIFRGIVFDRELSSSGELRVGAYDYLIYFLKSKGTYNFQNITPEQIVLKICEDAGVSAGKIQTTGTRVGFIAQDKSLYEIIMEAYSYVWKWTSGKYNYFAKMNKGFLDIASKGSLIEELELTVDKNISDLTYSDTASNMVNRVKIYDENNSFVGEINSEAWVKTYGVLQETYQVEEGNNPQTYASYKLHGIDQEISLSAVGDIRCKTGYAIKVKVPYLDILKDVVMYIDRHSFDFDMATGKFTMQLGLNLLNKMDVKEE